MLPSGKQTWLKVSKTSIFECIKSLKRNVKFQGYTFPANICASLERGMCRLYHEREPPPPGGPDQLPIFFTTLFWYLNVENVHKPQVSCRPTYFMTYFRAPISSIKCDNGSCLTADSLSVVSYVRTSAQHATNVSLAGAATPTVEREQVIDHARHENCDIHTLSMISDLTCPSMNLRDYIRHKIR